MEPTTRIEQVRDQLLVGITHHRAKNPDVPLYFKIGLANGREYAGSVDPGEDALDAACYHADQIIAAEGVAA